MSIHARSAAEAKQKSYHPEPGVQMVRDLHNRPHTSLVFANHDRLSGGRKLLEFHHDDCPTPRSGILHMNLAKPH